VRLRFLMCACACDPPDLCSRALATRRPTAGGNEALYLFSLLLALRDESGHVCGVDGAGVKGVVGVGNRKISVGICC